MTKPDLICKVVRGRRRTAAGTLSYIRRGCNGLFGQLRLGGITNDIAVDAAALASRHEGQGAEVKHVVLSLRHRDDQLLQKLAAQWVVRFAPGRSWLGGIHGSHIHLAVENEGEDGKPLDFRKKDVYEMAEMRWTDIASPAKAKVSSATVRFVQQHEASLRGLEGYGRIARWAEKQVGAGAFGVGRRDRAGRLISIALGGVRVRLKSVAIVLSGLARGLGRRANEIDFQQPEIPPPLTGRRREITRQKPLPASIPLSVPSVAPLIRRAMRIRPHQKSKDKRI